MDVNRLQKDLYPLENRPGIFVIGSSDVGKRTLLSRLLSVDFDDIHEPSSELSVHGWTINTKYYTADISVWMAHLHENFSIGSLPILNKLVALVMVFDMNDLSSFVALKDWLSRTDIQNFEILICIGNKVDLLPDHPVHVEYRRRLQGIEESSADYYGEYAISECEGTSLLGFDDSSWNVKKACLEWCTDHNIEFIEACASNAEFDKCLSVDGDSQGVERLYGALSAHMWPGMILKSGEKVSEPSWPENEDTSSEESDYELEYEPLMEGSADPWNGTENEWLSASSFGAGGSVVQDNAMGGNGDQNITRSTEDVEPSAYSAAVQDEIVNPNLVNSEKDKESDVDDKQMDLEDLEQLMSEIGNMRENLRLMPDFQRRQMAAKLAMKMAVMFGGGSEDEA